MKITILTKLKKLWSYVPKHRSRQFKYLLVLTLLASIFEVVSLGAVLPFIGILVNPDQIMSNSLFSGLIDGLGITSGSELLIPLTVVFITVAIIAAALRLLLLYFGIRLANLTGAELSEEVYRRTLLQPYSVHIERSSSSIISSITQKVGVVTSILIAIVSILTSGIIFIAIVGTIITVDPILAISAVIGFGIAYFFVAFIARSRLRSNSYKVANEQTRVVKAIQEGLGSIRDIILDGTHKLHIFEYRKSVMKLNIAHGSSSFINQAPRYVMEAAGMILIALFALAVSFRDGGILAALPVLAMLAISAQKLIPIMQQLYANWALILSSSESLSDVVYLLEQPLPEESDFESNEPYQLKESIRFKNISFKYKDNSPLILSELNLNIKKGSRVGIIGGTGLGKSTLVDLLMGLLKPTDGKIILDSKFDIVEMGNTWKKSIAHVPQNIFLSDLTIAENIAFGVRKDNIDLDRVILAARQAGISDFIENSLKGYQSFVGERGVRLSGGQRQRIGIARALYKHANILIFDEATSALDNETEIEVMKSIDRLSNDLTLFIIAHRITTLRNCDKIVELTNHGLKEIGNFEALEEYKK